MEEELKFPEGFFWGSATSSYQVEGGIENNDWAEAARRGLVPVCGRSSDHYHLFEKDFDIAKSLGHNAHRFSIEWARIEPEEGRFDRGAIEHYRKVISALKDRGMIPFVTLHHYTVPVWFDRRGGWLADDSPMIFARFVERVVGEYKELVPYWITFNETNVYTGFAFLKGSRPPFIKNPFTFFRVAGKLVMSHNLAYKKIKEIQPSAQIGIAENFTNFESNANPLYILIAKFLRWFINHRFLNQIQETQDFVGVNYYSSLKFGIKLPKERTDVGWAIDPFGFYKVIKAASRYKKPIFITENGLADADDTRRAKFIKDHLYWVARAIADNIDVRGYLHWSLLDNYEWDSGFGPRFGLVEVNYGTLERRVRPSAYDYAEICKSNALEVKY